ncbi:FAD/FMN-containing dehydrogenase [Prauserella isguenensis]|uniref:FAD/FMN-containing dehydrogenase n=1 Tax=Prauserella isguenensis TaxID=1470180 RepID=A0A839RZX5_9PSEU|nr:FAD-binding oxidoreductase [Prauserella isguenensis]MBB3050702.1 FAD/FMN-containing dehydrogenase [Prauserella isguenensis]
MTNTTDSPTEPPALDGALLLPGDDGFDAACTGYQLAVSHRPGCIVAASSAEDVRAAVTYAAARGLPVTARVSGHGHTAPLDGGVLVDLRWLSGVDLDPAQHTARIGGGATWQHVLDTASPHGLAPLSGSSPHVGAVPYTLGGGIGLLGRRYGYAADHVRALEVVTADGVLRQVTASSEDEPERELFRALRGGGAGGCIVTAMEIDLVEVSEVHGGSLYVDVAEAGDVLDRWRRWTEEVPDTVTSGVAMLVFPDVPGVPDELRGRQVAQLQLCVAEEGDAAQVDRLREMVPAVRDTVRTRPFAESGALFDEPDRPHAYRSRTAMVRALDPGALTRLPATVGPAAPVMCVAGLRHLGGAFARPPRVASAVGHREAAYLMSVLSPVTPTSEATDEEVAALHADVLAPFGPDTLGAHLSFAFGRQADADVRSAFTPPTADRLVRLRQRLDPRGTIPANHTISPR